MAIKLQKEPLGLIIIHMNKKELKSSEPKRELIAETEYKQLQQIPVQHTGAVPSVEAHLAVYLTLQWQPTLLLIVPLQKPHYL